MSTTLDESPESTDREVTTRPSQATLTNLLLVCGVLYSLSYVVANDVIAAARYTGYDRTSQAVSELTATGAPTRAFLIAMLPIWTVILIAFGVGVRRVGGDARERWLRVTGGLLIAQGVIGLLWLAFPMTSRDEMVRGSTASNDIGHIGLTVVTVILILSQLAFGAAAFRTWFRVYSAVTAAAVLVFGSLTGVQAGKVSEGLPTPWMGTFERINIGAWLLWLAVLAVVLLRRGIRRATGGSDRAGAGTPSAAAR